MKILMTMIMMAILRSRAEICITSTSIFHLTSYIHFRLSRWYPGGLPSSSFPCFIAVTRSHMCNCAFTEEKSHTTMQCFGFSPLWDFRCAHNVSIHQAKLKIWDRYHLQSLITIWPTPPFSVRQTVWDCDRMFVYRRRGEGKHKLDPIWWAGGGCGFPDLR